MKLSEAERLVQRQAEESGVVMALLRRAEPDCRFQIADCRLERTGGSGEMRICPGAEVHLQEGKWEVIKVALPIREDNPAAMVGLAAMALALVLVLLGVHH